MRDIAVLGAGITGITTAYALQKRGFSVTVIDRQPYAAMETSFANGGQLSASNAEVWTHWATVWKGLKWMFTPGAPLLFNPLPSWHKYSWAAEFLANIPNHEKHTIETARLAIGAREHLFRIAAEEGIDFAHERRGILHVYRDAKSFKAAARVNDMLRRAGLDRHAVSPDEMKRIEPALTEDYVGGYYTPSDSTGDIHLFTRGLARAVVRRGGRFLAETTVTGLRHTGDGVEIACETGRGKTPERLVFDGVVVCAGVASRAFAARLGDRVNIYPVKGYSITVNLRDPASRRAAPWVSLLDEDAKIVTSRLGAERFRVAGTAEFNGGNRDIRADRIQPLVDWVRRLFPGVATDSVVPWAGLRPMTPSMMPKVGPGRHPSVFYNTGHGHLGWTLSAATAELVADAVATGMSERRAVPLGPSPEPRLAA